MSLCATVKILVISWSSTAWYQGFHIITIIMMRMLKKLNIDIYIVYIYIDLLHLPTRNLFPRLRDKTHSQQN